MARKKQEKSAGSPGRRGPKDRKPKVQRTVVRGSREREPDWEGEHDSEAGEYPFYRLDASTQHFKSLADVALKVEWIKGSYLGPDLQSKTMDAKVVGDDKSNEGSQSAPSPDDAVPFDQGMREIAQMLGYGDMYAAHESENERFDWISRDPLMRDIVRRKNQSFLRFDGSECGNYWRWKISQMRLLEDHLRIGDKMVDHVMK